MLKIKWKGEENKTGVRYGKLSTQEGKRACAAASISEET